MKKYIIIFCSGLVVIMFIGMKKFNVESGPLTIALAGDVMLGRLVNEKIKQASYAYPWGNLLQELKRKDVVLINLETTLTNASTIVPKVFNFKADPAAVKTLEVGNITVVNLANNHSLDFDSPGLQETLATLDKAGIYHVGAGMNNAQAQKPVMLEKNGVHIGIMGYTDNEPGWLATANKPGLNYIDIDADNTEVFDAVRTLKSKVDICIVTLHWGPNMREYPSTAFINFAHRLIDTGVNIVHGHSAHVVQGVERYRDGIILYDTGDFIDDYMIDQQLRNDLSFLFTIEIEQKKLKRLQLLPVKIDAMQVNKAAGVDATTIINLMKQRSSPFGTVFEQHNTMFSIPLS